jgi:hypothetical protein
MSVQHFSNKRIGVEKVVETTYVWSAEDMKDIMAASPTQSDMVDETFFLAMPGSDHPTRADGDAYITNPLKFSPTRVEWYAKVNNAFGIATVTPKAEKVSVSEIVSQHIYREFKVKNLKYFVELPNSASTTAKWQVMVDDDSRSLIPTDGMEYQIASFTFADSPIMYSVPVDGSTAQSSIWMVCTGLVGHQMFNPTEGLVPGGVSLRCRLTYLDMDQDQDTVQTYQLPSTQFYNAAFKGIPPTKSFFSFLRGVVKVVGTVLHVVTGVSNFVDHVSGKSFPDRPKPIQNPQALTDIITKEVNAPPRALEHKRLPARGAANRGSSASRAVTAVQKKKRTRKEELVAKKKKIVSARTSRK